jgi:DNA polymerase-3 subunit gamma/tau
MLSVGAFNAFLKTLEEPPAHVKFVFATTEIHKVPITIRSRCQRYDFRLIPHAVVAERVREILRAEQIVADDAAIALVAREAAGSMRDALTVLDQVLALGDTELHGDSVARGLAIASRESVLRATEALLSGDAAACLQCVAAVAEQGLDLLHFTRQLLECARDLVVLRVVGAGSDAAVALTPDELARAKQLADAHERAELERLFGGLTKLIEEVGQAAMPQMTLEMGLVRLASRPPLVAVQELITRLKGFEDLLSGGGPQGPTHGGPAPSGFSGGSGSRAPQRASGPSGMSSSPSGSDLPRQTGPSGGPQLRDASQIGAPARQPGPYAVPPEAAARPPGPYAAPQLRDATLARGPGIAPKDAVARQAGPAAAPQLRDAAPQPTEAIRPPARLVAVPSPAPTPATNDAANQASLDAGQPRPADAAQQRGSDAGLPPLDASLNLSAGAAAALRLSQSLARNQEPAAPRAARPGPGAGAPAFNSRLPAPPSGDQPPPQAAARGPAAAPPPAAALSALRAAPPPAAASDAPRAAPALLEGDGPTAVWSRIVGQLRSAQPALGAVLDHGMPLEVSATTLRIGFPDGSFFGRQAQANSARDALLKAAEQVLGARPNLLIGSPSPGDTKISTLAEIEEDGRRQRSAAKREAALSHPAVIDAMEIFEESAASVDVQTDLE